MSAKIHELREAFDAVAKTLGSKDVRVQRRGADFGISYGRTEKDTVLTLPELPDNATPELIGKMRGVVDLVGARLFYSDGGVTQQAEADDIAGLFEMLEDARCEKAMVRRLPGTRRHFASLRDRAMQEIYEPRREEVMRQIGAGDVDSAFVAMAPMVQRALMGDATVKSFLGPDILNGLQPVIDKVGDLLGSAADLDSAAAELGRAKQIMSLLNLPPPPPPPPQEGGDGEEGEEGEEQQSDEDGEGGGEGESEDNGEPEDGDGDGEGKPDEGDGEDQGQGQGDGEGEGEAKPEKGDGQPGEGKAGGAGEGQGQDAGDDPVDAQAADGKFQFGGPPFKSMADELIRQLQDDIVLQFNDAEYIVYSRDFDKIVPIKEFATPAKIGIETFRSNPVPKFIEDSSKHVGVIKNRLERALEARSFAMKVGSQRSGRVSSNSLHRLFIDDPRVFHKIEEAPEIDTAVYLLIDCSGSMNEGDGGYGKGKANRKLDVAAESAYALASAMHRIKVRTEIGAFTTDGETHELANGIEEFQRKIGKPVSRRGTLSMPIIKTFDENFSNRTASRLVEMSKNWQRGANIDGECVDYAAWRLMKQRVSRRILLVLSDGRPNGASHDPAVYSSHLRKTVKEVEARGIHVVGIGIKSQAVGEFYKNHVVVTDVSELGGVVLDKLRQLLIPQK